MKFTATSIAALSLAFAPTAFAKKAKSQGYGYYEPSGYGTDYHPAGKANGYYEEEPSGYEKDYYEAGYGGTDYYPYPSYEKKMNAKAPKRKGKKYDKESYGAEYYAEDKFDNCVFSNPTLNHSEFIIAFILGGGADGVVDDPRTPAEDLVLKAALTNHAKFVNGVFFSLVADYVNYQDTNAIIEKGKQIGKSHPSLGANQTSATAICNLVWELVDQMVPTCEFSKYEYTYAAVSYYFANGFAMGYSENENADFEFDTDINDCVHFDGSGRIFGQYGFRLNSYTY